MKKSSYSCIIFLIIVLGSIPSNSNLKMTDEIKDGYVQNPNSQDYQTNSSGSYNDVELKIHQAYHNSSNITINQDKSSFTIPAPNAVDFSTSNINISIKDLSVGNHDFVVQDNTGTSSYNVGADPCSTSFVAPSSCYLLNASFFTHQDNAQVGTMTVYVYNATVQGNALVPDFNNETTLGTISVNSIPGDWEDISISNYYLDNSKTINNTWFLGLKDDGGSGKDSRWGYVLDSTDGDDSQCYISTYPSWTPINFGGTLDFKTKVGLGFSSSVISPSDINLKLNSTEFTENLSTTGSGWWNSSQSYSGNNDELNFSITADWFNYEFNITAIQVNFTKNFGVDTFYTVKSENDVYWVSNLTLDNFDNRLDNNTINITFPVSWTPTSLWNSTVDMSIYKNPIFQNSTHKIVSIFGSDATNGAWELNCTSTNFLSSVKLGIGGIEQPLVYSNDTLEINATFSSTITGNVNFSIYNPVGNDQMVYSGLNISGNGLNSYFTNWDIKNEIVNYGEHRVQVTWQNSTDFAIYDTTIMIAGATNYTLQNLNGTEILDSADPYNITVHYQDILTHQNVTGARIGSNQSGIWFSEVQNNDDETYNITIDPSQFSLGSNFIAIIINKTNYMNYTFYYHVNIVTDMQVENLYASSILTAIRENNCTFQLNYNQTSDETVIIGATISEESIEPGLIWSFDDLGSGNYEIPINTSLVDVGTYTCNFSISKLNYETVQFSFNITIEKAQTELQIINKTDIVSRALYQNATIYFRIWDSSNNANITGVSPSSLTVFNETSSIEQWDISSQIDWNMWEVGSGVYGANINLSTDSERLDSGSYAVTLNVSFLPNFNYSTLYFPFFIRGNLTELDNIVISGDSLVEISPNNYSLYQLVSDINVEFDFNNIEGTNYVLTYDNTGSKIFNYWVYCDGNETLLVDDIEWVVGDGKNRGSIILGDLPTELHNISIVVGLKNYENTTYTFNITILDLKTNASINALNQPSRVPILTNGNYTIYAYEDLLVRIFYNDTINDDAILGASYAILNYNSINYAMTTSGGGIYEYSLSKANFILGSNTVTIYLGEEKYDNASLTFDIFVMNVSTEAVIDNVIQSTHDPGITAPFSEGNYTIYAYDEVDITILYNDTLNVDDEVNNADYAWIEYGSISESMVFISNGIYSYQLQLEDLILDSNTITIYFGKDDYDNATLTFDIFVLNVSTEAVIDNVIQFTHDPGITAPFSEGNYTIYAYDEVDITILYNDTLNGRGINSADYAWIDYGFISESMVFVSNGIYSYQLQLEDLILGSNTITIYFGKDDYDNATLTFDIFVENVTTSVIYTAITQQNTQLAGSFVTNFTAYDPFDVVVNFTYRDTLNDNIPISGATYVLLTYNGSNYYGDDLGNGVYNWTIPANNLELGLLDIYIYFGLEDYDNASTSFKLNVSTLSTYVEFDLNYIRQPDRPGHSTSGLVFENGNYTAYHKYAIQINASYYDYVNEGYLSGAYAILNFNNHNITALTDNGGTYGWIIPIDYLDFGSLTATIYFGLDTYDNATFSLDIFIYNISTSALLNNIIQPNHASGTRVPYTNGNYTVYAYDVLDITILFNDTLDNLGILDASYAVLNYAGSNYFMNSDGFGIYSYQLQKNVFLLGSNNITIYFGMEFYENASLTFSIFIMNVSTDAEIHDVTQPAHLGAVTLPQENSAFVAYIHYSLKIDILYNDTINNVGVNDASYALLIYEGTSYQSVSQSNGIYSWNILSSNLVLGESEINILFGLEDYDNASIVFTINVKIVPTWANFSNIYQPEHALTTLRNETNTDSFTAYQPYNLMFNISYVDFTLGAGIEDATVASLLYNEIVYTSNYQSNGLYGWIIPSEDLIMGEFRIEVTFEKGDYSQATFIFNVTIIGEYIVTIERISIPETMVQGDSYNIIFKLSYRNGSTDYPIVGGDVRLLTNHTEISVLVGVTNATGHAVFTFIAPQGDYQNLLLTVEYGGELYGVSDQSSPFAINIVSPTILPSWLIYALLILVGGVSLAIVVQKKVIAPRKMHYTDLVMSSSTIFDDAINLHHIMIIHKATGVSLFFKSFAEEELDPDLISGFLSAVQSFGKEIKSQKSLNELSYGDKILLFSDGVFIRVTLVLGKSASPYMKRNLAKFVGRFEAEYHTKLEKWRGQLNTFADAGDLIDDILNTSVILPHQYNADSKLLKGISRALTKQILDISKTLITEERNFMFLAQLLSVAIDQTKKQPGEIILSITELLDAKILTPIKLDVLEEQALTDQELRTLRERVWAIPNKSEDEKQQILTDVTQLSEAERDVAIQSLSQTLTITSETTGEVIKSKIFETEGDARKEIKELNKLAKKALKSHEFDEAIRNYEIAEVIAYQWNMENLGKTYGNLVLSNTVTKYKTTLKQKTKEGQKFMKAKEFQSAFNAFKLALEAAHSLFKMGYIEVEDNIKDLVKRSGEALKYCEDSVCDKEYYTKETLMEYRKFLLKELKSATKAKDLFMQTELNTKLLLISNILFKFGIGAENSNIKKYHSDIDTLLKKMNELDGEMKTAMDGVRAGFIQSKEILMEEAISFEKVEDWINALITYQKILDIYCKIGDADNALNLRTKIDILIQKIPDLHDSITYFSQECDRHRNESKDANMAEICLDNANLLKDAIFYRD
ncbi:hypothetical protein [Candidatus Lokiarchaeum ossiferum]|uniref:hypothetical protein n=1 Tax=Candidatus Lokiarchaeum ossiferum TaxID=2951803 RepID=UPI00352D0E25